jgi:thiamine transporter ThiT
MKKRTSTLKMVLSALFLALAYIMPYITGQIPEFGSMLCPMHIPVLLCGFICGWQWGLLVGLASPLFRSAIAGMPPMFPTAICMAFELSAYGAVSGIMYRLLPKKKINVYVSLLTSMLVGRIVWGCAMLIALGLNGKSFGLTAFIAGAFTNALPGIAAQIILVPVIVIVIEMQNIFKENQHK